MLLPRTTSDLCESSIFGILAATNACGFIRRAGVWDSNGHSFSNDTRLTCEFGACGAGGMSLTQGQQTAIANAAKSWFGTPYVYGGCLRTGADCSGSVYAIYLMAGIKLPHKFSSGEYPKSPLFQKVTGAPQVGDVGWYPGHVVIYGGVTGPNGDDVWSATHTGGDPFGPAKSSWFGTPTWYRYVGP